MEEEELKAEIRRLEQQQLAQMRQGAILQSKLEEAQRQQRELQQDLKARYAQVLKDQQEEQMRREQEAMARLEEDLQKRLEELRTREVELEKSLRSEQTRKNDLDDEVHYWRSCGHALLKRTGGQETEVLEEAAKKEIDLQVEMKALEAQGSELRSRIKEVERMVALGRAQEVELVTKNQGLLHCVALAQQKQVASQTKAASLQVELQKVEAVKTAVSPEAIEEGSGQEEVEYWRRKKQDKALEVERLSHEERRLKALLLRSGAADVTEYLSTRGCGMLDESISWFATSLFKSAFIRRAFCVHGFLCN